jgi:protein-tyrosine phosphatase
MDERWATPWPATILDWPDWGTPIDQEAAASAIRTAFEAARGGLRVEVGCVAGVGRTGTVIACMAVLAGIPVEKSVEWVRENYNSRAVETGRQRRWIEWFAS